MQYIWRRTTLSGRQIHLTAEGNSMKLGGLAAECLSASVIVPVKTAFHDALLTPIFPGFGANSNGSLSGLWRTTEQPTLQPGIRSGQRGRVTASGPVTGVS